MKLKKALKWVRSQPSGIFFIKAVKSNGYNKNFCIKYELKGNNMYSVKYGYIRENRIFVESYDFRINHLDVLGVTTFEIYKECPGIVLEKVII